MLLEWILAWMDKTDAWSPHDKPAEQNSLHYLQQVPPHCQHAVWPLVYEVTADLGWLTKTVVSATLPYL